MYVTQSSEKSKLKLWPAVEFEVEAAQEDLACWLMMQLGSCGCQVKELSAGSILVTAVFEQMSCAAFVELRRSIGQYELSDAVKDLRITNIEEDDWLRKWKEDLRPIHVGHNFVISPPWFREQVEREYTSGAGNTGACTIYIEPGMAFGTGLHATTQYCLCALEECLASHNQPHSTFNSILDVGTGSGILAIAAAKLNPKAKIIALDTDSVCIEVAKQNIKLNNVLDRIVVQAGSTDICSNLGFDCIVANISYEDISKLLLEFLRLLRPGGRLILAGVLAEKLKPLERDIESYPLHIVNTKLDGEWIGVTLERIGVVVKPAARHPSS